MPLGVDLRTRTTLVCGALALAIAASMLLRGRVRTVHLLFCAFAADIGLWYLSQSFFGFFRAEIWERFTAILAVFLPQFALHLFEAMIPHEPGRRSRLLRGAWITSVPLVVLILSPQRDWTAVRIAIFVYVFALFTAGLYQLGQRGKTSSSRATQRRVRFLVVIGAAAGLASVADFLWFLGAETPPIGAALSVVFLFVLAQALRYERLLDLYEMVARLLVATAVAFLIAFIFYVFFTFIGAFKTMYVNAILAAIVLLVLFEPLQQRVEEQMRKLFFRERFDLEGAIRDVRRRLVHVLEVGELGAIVVAGLEQSRRLTHAAFYLRDTDGTGFDQIATLGARVPTRIEFATARPLLERLDVGPVDLEEVTRERDERRSSSTRTEAADAILSAAEVLGSLKEGVVIGVRAEGGDLVGLLCLADDRVRDALSPEEIALAVELATQIGVVVENSLLYKQMKERDRLAVLGQMAAGLAHEIRNPLGAIKGAAQLLAEPGPDGEEVDASSREFLGIILEEVDRLNRVVGSVLDLARPNQSSVGPVDVNGVIRRTVQVLSGERGHDQIEMAMQLLPELPRVAIDPELLRQVLMNLIRNGAQAMKGKGRVQVSTNVRFGRGTRSGGGAEETHVEIHVADTGPGISQKVMDSIFLPFFTTKEKGTGLGLAISQRIVQGAGGRIDVRSYEGRGSTFTVLLPAAMEALGTPAPGRASSPSDTPSDAAREPAAAPTSHSV